MAQHCAGEREARLVYGNVLVARMFITSTALLRLRVDHRRCHCLLALGSKTGPLEQIAARQLQPVPSRLLRSPSSAVSAVESGRAASGGEHLIGVSIFGGAGNL
jgi:hypothetical protein